MTKNEIKTDTLSIDDVWDAREPIVLHSWLGTPKDPGRAQTATLSWLKTNEVALVEHIEWMLNAIDHLEADHYAWLLDGHDDDDVGYYPRSLYDHACSNSVTDIGCHELAEWATGLCAFEFQRRAMNATKANDPDTSTAVLNEEDALEWERLVGAVPKLRDIETRAWQFVVPPHLHGTFAGVHSAWPCYGQLYGEAIRLLNDLYDTSGEFEGLVRAWAVARKVTWHAVERES